MRLEGDCGSPTAAAAIRPTLELRNEAIACMALGNLSAARLGDRWSARRLGCASFLTLGGGLVVTALAGDLRVLAAAQAALGLGAGLASPARSNTE